MEVTLLRFGLLITKIGVKYGKKLREMVEHAWIEYMGYNYLGDLEAGNLTRTGHPTWDAYAIQDVHAKSQTKD